MGERDFSRFRDFSEDFCRGTVHGIAWRALSELSSAAASQKLFTY